MLYVSSRVCYSGSQRRGVHTVGTQPVCSDCLNESVNKASQMSEKLGFSFSCPVLTTPTLWEGGGCWLLTSQPESICGAKSMQELKSGLEPVQSAV